MKITANDYAVLESAIKKVIDENPQATVQSYQAKGLTPKRFRWDCLWEAVRKRYVLIGQSHNKPTFPAHEQEVYLSLYDYANDDHIDTALRKITATA